MQGRLRHRGWQLVLGVSLAWGCSGPSSIRTAQIGDDLIYGDDNRRDVYAVADTELAQIATRSTVAFLSADHLVSNATGQFEIVSDSLGVSNNLCPDEAFATQPAAATCSGVLVDDQLVLTAGHCISDDATCDDQLLVFDYAITDPQRELVIDRDAVYRCKSIPARHHGTDPDGRRWDFGFIELDRPVDSARRPVQIASEVLPVGSRVAVIGFPSGLPVKVDAGADLLYQRSCLDYFTLDSDTFQSSSGSGVFDDRGRLAGIFVRGGADYEFVPERGCAVSRRIAGIADPLLAEQASYLASAITSLCATGWASAHLCLRSDPPGTASAQAATSCASETVDLDAPDGCSAAGRWHGRGRSGSGFVATALAALMALRRRRAGGHRLGLKPTCCARRRQTNVRARMRSRAPSSSTQVGDAG